MVEACQSGSGESQTPWYEWGGGASPKESPYTDLIPDIFGKVSALIDGMEGRMDGGDEGIFAYDAEDER